MTGAKTECLRHRGNTVLHDWTVCKRILVVTLNKMMKLEMNIFRCKCKLV